MTRRLLRHPTREEAIAEGRPARVVGRHAGQCPRGNRAGGGEARAQLRAAGGRGAFVRRPARHSRLQAASAAPLLAPNGFVWISRPKKASRVPTDITEDVIREVALPLGLIDVKVCAVDDTWSGLKLVIRKGNR